MANFLHYANSKIAKELGRLHHWRGGLFEHRYTSIPLSEEPEIQPMRLRYLLSQGCKEGLVASPKHWPGVTAVKELTNGDSLEGIWIDRSAQHRARECGRDAPDGDSGGTDLAHRPAGDRPTHPSVPFFPFFPGFVQSLKRED